MSIDGQLKEMQLLVKRTLSFPLKNAWILGEKYHTDPANAGEVPTLIFRKVILGGEYGMKLELL